MVSLSVVCNVREEHKKVDHIYLIHFVFLLAGIWYLLFDI